MSGLLNAIININWTIICNLIMSILTILFELTCNEHLLSPEDSNATVWHSTKDPPKCVKETVCLFNFDVFE